MLIYWGTRESSEVWLKSRGKGPGFWKGLASEGIAHAGQMLLDHSPLLPPALSCADRSQASQASLFSLSYQELRQCTRVTGTGCQGHRESCKGPGDHHLIATGQSHAEAWSGRPLSCRSAGEGRRQDREEEGSLWLPTSPQPPPPLQWTGPVAASFQPPIPWDTQSVLGLARDEGAAGAGSGQGIEVHSNQRLPPVAEVAEFRVGQVCAGATGHRWEQELDHLTQPFVPAGRTGPALRVERPPGPSPHHIRQRPRPALEPWVEPRPGRGWGMGTWEGMGDT